jgi:hypothetical protein
MIWECYDIYIKYENMDEDEKKKNNIYLDIKNIFYKKYSIL